MTGDLVTLSSPGLTAMVNPLGAELWSLKDAEGRELMTDADPAYWTGHAPLLFPIVGTLNGDTYRLEDGRRFTLPRHGFARRKTFTLVDQGPSHVLFSLSPDKETRAIYPFVFHLDMAFVLEGATLALTATVANMGDDPMPFSIGFHPAFAWPLPYGAPKEAHQIVFEKDEPGPIRRLNDSSGLVAPVPFPTPVEGRTFAPTAKLFKADAIIWDEMQSRSLTWGAPGTGTPHLEIDYPDTPMLGVWQKPGAHYLCIEPWAGIADPADYHGSFEAKPGVMTLAPGDSRLFRVDVTLVRP